MAFDPDAYLSTPTAKGGGFDPDEFLKQPKSVSGFAKNAVEDVVGTAKGLGHLADAALEHPVDTAVAVGKNIIPGIVEEGKRLGVGELLTGHPINAVEKLWNAAYDKPLTTALSVVPAVGAAGKVAGAGMKALRGAGMAEEAANLAAKTALKEAPAALADDLIAVPKGNIGKSATMEAAEDFAKNPPKPPVSSLPEIKPGLKTGEPHALFAYTDNFGPGGAKRDIYNVFGDPNHPSLKARGWGSSVPLEEVEKLGIPVTGRQPGAKSLLDKLPDAIKDPLKEVNDFVTAKYGKAAAQPGFVERSGDILSNFAGDVRGKDLGLRPGQIQSMGQGFKGIEKAEELLDYADSKGYFDLGLSDATRKTRIKSALETSGRNLGAIRDVASQRGTAPAKQILETVKAELTKQFGEDAPAEVQKVLTKIEKRMTEDSSFSAVADLATELNKAKTPARSMGQHPGPTTEAANIVARLNNQATKALLNEKEAELFTNSLRDFGAHKKLEQAVSNSARRSMSGRSGQLGSLTNRLVQNILDSGGYRVGGKLAGRLGKAMKANPERFKTLPDFFEELAHHADDVLDDVIDPQNPGMAHGGIAGFDKDELHRFLAAKYEKPKEKMNQ